MSVFIPFKTPVLKSTITGPKCKHCKFYLKKENSKLGECKKFPRISSQKGVLYEFAEICRKDIELCGHSGYHFEVNELFEFFDF